MRGIKINGVHTGNDLKMILNSLDITPPELKENYIDVEGLDGSLDFTEFSGCTKYRNRTVTAVFTISNSKHLLRYEEIDNIVQKWHGKKVKLKIDDKSGYYLEGRCKVTGIKNLNRYMEMTLEFYCKPYFICEASTVVTATLTGTEREVTINNTGTKNIVPTIHVSGTNVLLKFDSYSKAMSTGKYKIVDLLVEGHSEKKVKLSGSGTVLFEWYEEVL